MFKVTTKAQNKELLLSVEDVRRIYKTPGQDTIALLTSGESVPVNETIDEIYLSSGPTEFLKATIESNSTEALFPFVLIKSVEAYGSQSLIKFKQLASLVVTESLADLEAQIALISAPDITVGNTLFVTATGDDATGERNKLNKAFATPWAAIAAAQAGDTVVVYPGDYKLLTQLGTERIVKNGVKMFCHPGVYIGFLSTSNSTGAYDSPFSDSAGATPAGSSSVMGIYGYAKITYLGSASTNLTPCLSHPDSELTIQCDYLDHRTRLSAVNYKYWKIEARYHAGRDTSAIRAFNQFATDSTFIYNVETFEQDNSYKSTTIGNGQYSPFQFDQHSENGLISINIKTMKYKTSFYSQGLFFLQRLECPVTIKVGDLHFTELGNVGYENDYNLIGSCTLCSGKMDVEVHASLHNGLLWRFAAAGFNPITGRMKFTGNYKTPNEPIINAGARPTIYGICVGSSLEVVLDLQVIDYTGTLLQWLNATMNGDQAIHITGKMRYAYDGVKTSHPFAIFPSSGNKSPVFKGFSMQTDSTFFALGTGAPVIDVPCMSTFSNAGLDPTYHNPVIELVTVSPSVIA